MNHHDALIEFMKDKEIRIMAEIGAWKSNMTKRVLGTYDQSIFRYWATDIWGWNEANEGYTRMPEEYWDKLYLKACQLMHQYPQLRVIKGSSLKIFRIFPQFYFDLVFIDADHHYDFMINTIKNWLPLIKTNGFLIGKIPRGEPDELLRAVSDCLKKTTHQNNRIWIYNVR